jgi:hypothetical protein
MTQDKSREAFKVFFDKECSNLLSDACSIETYFDVWQAARADILALLESDRMVEVVAHIVAIRLNGLTPNTLLDDVAKETSKAAIAAIMKEIGR